MKRLIQGKGLNVGTMRTNQICQIIRLPKTTLESVIMGTSLADEVILESHQLERNKGEDMRTEDELRTGCSSDLEQRDYETRGEQNIRTRRLQTTIFSKLLPRVLPKGLCLYLTRY